MPLVLRSSTTQPLTKDQMDGNWLTLQQQISSLQTTVNTLSSGTYILPIASTSVLGGIKIDGSSINITNGVISTTLPIASTSVLGIAKIGNGLDVDGAGTVSTNIRTRLTAPLVLYVSPTGSNVNNGLTTNTPFQTIQYAWDILSTNYDLVGHQVTIQLLDGVYTTGLVAQGLLTGQLNPNQVTLSGNFSTPTSVIISTTGTNCIYTYYDAKVYIRDLVVQTTGVPASCLVALYNGTIVVGPGITFGPCVNQHCAVSDNGNILIPSSYSITGGCQVHWLIANSGYLATSNGITVTIVGSPTITVGFALAQSLSQIIATGITFVGGVSGSGIRYSSDFNSVIVTNSSGLATYFPGNVAGTVSMGGLYS